MKHAYKRLFSSAASAVLCGSMLFGLLPMGALTASALDYGPMKYKDYGDHIEILSCEKDITELVIPEEIDGVPVTKIGQYVFKDNTKLQKVVLPDSMEMISGGAFDGCTALTDLDFGNGLVTIGGVGFGGNFRGCTSLKEVKLPDSLQIIGSDAFSGCTALSTLIIGESVSSIGMYAFRGCTALESVCIPDSVQEIGMGAFESCIKLSHLELGDEIKKIQANAFAKCPLITEVKLGNHVESIYQDAFSGSSIKEIVIPYSVKWIGGTVFASCTDLQSITILSPDCYYNYSILAYNEMDTAGHRYFNGVIYGFTGSTAEQHAHGNGCKFIALNNGDINCDGQVDLVDAVILARAAAGSETVEISPLGRLYAELDGEEGLGQGDLTLLLRKLAGW